MGKHRSSALRIGLASMVAASFGLAPPAAQADEADAKTILQAMSDYLGAQERVGFDFDSTLEVVTADGQKLQLASSGSAALERPNRIHASRMGGFVDVDMVFDGTTFTVLGRNANVYAQAEIPGTIDHLVDQLRETYGFALPAADLLLADAYPELMDGVTDVKDLGSGVIAGVECDSLAFRKDEVDFQIWVAQGERPYPCRYVITSTQVEHGPQYTVQVRDWRTGEGVAPDGFVFTNATGATEVDLAALREQVGDLPENFSTGAAQ